MKQRWAALATVIALSVIAPRFAAAQATMPGVSRERGSGSELGQNSPNPFTTETKIPFTIGDYPTCSGSGVACTVSPCGCITLPCFRSCVAVLPVLQGGSGSVADGACS